MKEKLKKITESIEDFSNQYGFDKKDFCIQMDNIHRTCQQSFGRLIFGWIKHLSESQNFDNRNKQTVEVSKKIVEAYRE